MHSAVHTPQPSHVLGSGNRGLHTAQQVVLRQTGPACISVCESSFPCLRCPQVQLSGGPAKTIFLHIFFVLSALQLGICEVRSAHADVLRNPDGYHNMD